MASEELVRIHQTVSKMYLEGREDRDGKRCEGTFAKGVIAGGIEGENGGEAGDLTHVVKAKRNGKRRRDRREQI